jgi:hypothetical protein
MGIKVTGWIGGVYITSGLENISYRFEQVLASYNDGEFPASIASASSARVFIADRYSADPLIFDTSTNVPFRYFMDAVLQSS